MTLTITLIGGPTALIEIDGFRLLTDPLLHFAFEVRQEVVAIEVHLEVFAVQSQRVRIVRRPPLCRSCNDQGTVKIDRPLYSISMIRSGMERLITRRRR